MAKPVELHYTASPINTVEWTKLNENWDRIMSGFEAMRDQIRILAGGVEVDEILERINTAVENAEATTADMILLIVEANTKISEITQAISESREVTDTANSIINQLTALKGDLESLKAELEGISEAESTRKANENARINAENVRKSNEDTRQSNEQIRQVQEETRQQNEANRQTTFDNQMQQINNVLPNVQGLENKGSWNATTQYYKNNIVERNGNSYQALKDNINQPPPTPPEKSNEFWSMIAQRGVDGTGAVSTVNGIFPDTEGNVELTAHDIDAISVSEKGVVGGVARLNEDGKVVDASGNEVEGKVKTVNGIGPDESGNIEIETATSWNDLSDIPTSFPPSAHTHQISEVNGLQDALNEKASSEDLMQLQQEFMSHSADIVQTDEVNSSEKYPSSAVTYVHGQRISKIENDLKKFSVVLKNYNLSSNKTYEFSGNSSLDVFLIITHQGGAYSSLRSAHLVFCAIPGYNGSVVTLAPGSYIEVKYENDKILITNTHSTADCYLSIVKLF